MAIAMAIFRNRPISNAPTAPAKAANACKTDGPQRYAGMLPLNRLRCRLDNRFQCRLAQKVAHQTRTKSAQRFCVIRNADIGPTFLHGRVSALFSSRFAVLR
jgi:hypothetical protein